MKLKAQQAGEPAARPVVVVHGILDNARRIAPLVDGLTRRGVARVHAIDLVPPWGNERLEVLAAQLADYVADIRARYAAEHVDVVGFSMGALVSRAYLQLLGGHERVRTFVSISGPHRGTWTAHALPFLVGVGQMRPDSALLQQLGDDVSELARVAVHCVYTPFDTMIVPSDSSVLKGARSVHRIPVLVHRLMLSDRRVLDLVARLLRTG